MKAEISVNGGGITCRRDGANGCQWLGDSLSAQPTGRAPSPEEACVPAGTYEGIRTAAGVGTGLVWTSSSRRLSVRIRRVPQDVRSAPAEQAGSRAMSCAASMSARCESPSNVAALHAWLVAEHDYPAGLRSVQRYVHRAYPAPARRARRRVETPPGFQAQADWVCVPLTLHRLTLRRRGGWTRRSHAFFTQRGGFPLTPLPRRE